MTFLDEVTRATGRPCTVAAVMAGLPDDVRDDVQAAMDDRRAQHKRIAQAMEERGWTRPDGKHLTQLQIGLHRRGDCSCG